MCVYTLCVCLVPAKKTLDLLELELKMVMRYHVGTEPRIFC